MQPPCSTPAKADEGHLHEASLLGADTQHSTVQDTGPCPRDGDGRLSQVGCDSKPTGNPFEGCEDLLEAGIEDWNMDFAIARTKRVPTTADAHWLPGKSDVVLFSRPDTNAETVMSGCMSTSSCSSRCSESQCDSVPSMSPSDMRSSEISPHYCNSILGTSLRAVDDGTNSPWLGTHLPASSLRKHGVVNQSYGSHGRAIVETPRTLGSATTGQCETMPQMQTVITHVALKPQPWSIARVQFQQFPSCDATVGAAHRPHKVTTISPHQSILHDGNAAINPPVFKGKVHCTT